MGWGCYKHECDMDSPNAVRKLNILCEKRLERDKKDWGRNGAICPYCWEELEQERDQLREALELIQGFNWQLDDSAHGREIKARALAALAR